MIGFFCGLDWIGLACFGVVDVYVWLDGGFEVSTEGVERTEGDHRPSDRGGVDRRSMINWMSRDVCCDRLRCESREDKREGASAPSRFCRLRSVVPVPSGSEQVCIWSLANSMMDAGDALQGLG